ncbi:MAG: methylenetetrahydrofolate--tRNA-(uracil(54)-C(5))-methyltransferase (FADH(2)-oxidizing) TrmFO [Deltaproteobacteria bacterium]|jgi:methylenetetrahydrofolate--tRNA-(uracil-5-)-methyltransferase|nr:methylenetetrahydrofolate--tRNA-(uracil(54)-C(5))-methyltransferase (FADH(2)-oxidizing) TrmFO [Deltaproteobacteria bacterium]
MKPSLTVVGGGLSGCEAAYRAAAYGLKVRLVEMKPILFSPAHSNPDLAELVCSNSFRSDDLKNAVGLLKAELRRLGSIVMLAADQTRVPAGRALAVDRESFSQLVTSKLGSLPQIEIVRDVFQPPLNNQGPLVIAAGPLAEDALTEALSAITGAENLHFYDAVAPVVTKESLDLSRMFFADRYGQAPGGDYLNAPMDKELFVAFLNALKEADQSEKRTFENERYFEGCLPIEVMAQRGVHTLAYGPMKPVGLIDPKTNQRPYAAVQLRREDEAGTHWNIVGFQTRLTRQAQMRVFRLIPGLENAQFARFGSIHRNTFLTAPKVLDPYQRLKVAPEIFIAGQLSGVEGYVESAAQGLWAGENAARYVLGKPLVRPPEATASGALLGHLTRDSSNFSPSNITFGLFPPVPPNITKAEQASFRQNQSQSLLEDFLREIDYPLGP